MSDIYTHSYWPQCTSRLPSYLAGNESPALPHRRVPLSRRHRLYIIFTITILLWYRYLRPELSDESQETLAYSNIARSYSLERERVVPPVASTLERKFQSENEPIAGRPIAPEPERRAESVDVPPALQQGPQRERELAKGRLVDLPAILQRNDDEPQAPITPPVKEASPEYAGEEVPRKQAVLDTSSKGDSEPSDIAQQEPTELVKQASEKLVEQHLMPAVIYDEVRAGKEESINRHLSQKYGHKKFPVYSEYAALDEKGEALPDIVHMPFEDTTADVKLQE